VLFRSGIVAGIQSYGAFIDVGANKEGMVPISAISTSAIRHPSDVLKPGSAVKVWVTSVEDGKLTLTMIKDRQAASKATLEGFLDVGEKEWLHATVEGILDFGIKVGVCAPGSTTPILAMVHVSQIQEAFIDHPSQVVKVGQAIRVRVVEVDMNKGRVSLSMREPIKKASAQDVSAAARCKPTDWLDGRVVKNLGFGALIALTLPGSDTTVEGLLHISNMKKEGFVANAGQLFKNGDEVQVRIVGVDTKGGRVSLSNVPLDDTR